MPYHLEDAQVRPVYGEHVSSPPYHNPYLYLFFVGLIASLGITLVVLILCLLTSSARFYTLFYVPATFAPKWYPTFSSADLLICAELIRMLCDRLELHLLTSV
ncbi:otopetrin-2-like [Tropilaelaps mercedesae]|uniref:Otopetrin-2-like n=1 Tax=Tropilaelaps mercedesae TaxID=418985 RepID=A0A1V9XYV5_9ACAR|nr:otopetrin-2-like [Tropilaelaps mercedesae]